MHAFERNYLHQFEPWVLKYIVPKSVRKRKKIHNSQIYISILYFTVTI